ncbi:MAG: GNAT family N-acetyltransferase [Bacteriovorax sp.]|nr:GNAT family N-acetyltransferase [Bacteriovorax sp.]
MQTLSSYAKLLNSSLKTDRLLIEPIYAEHADSLFELMQNKKIYQWISSTPPQSIDQLKVGWKKHESRLSPDGNEAWLNWAVRRTSDGAYIGKMDAEVNHEKVATNIGYIFFPDYWGKGYASESVLEIKNHFSRNGISKIMATVTLGNETSYRVLEKSGFIRTRIIPENDIIRGEKYDDVEYVWQF